MTKTSSRLAALIATCVALAGCANKPTLEAAVFRNFGPNAIILPGSNAIPDRNSPRYTSNDYNYPPGTLLRDVNYTQPNLVSAGKFRNRLTFCPQYTIYLSASNEQKFEDIEEVRIFDLSFSLFTPIDVRRQFVDELGIPDIPDHTLAYLDSASLKLKNVRTYEVDDRQVQTILADNKRRGQCPPQGYGRAGPYSHLVKRIYVADVETKLVWKAGWNTSIAVAHSKIVRAMSSSYSGRKIIIALALDPLARHTNPLAIVFR